MLFLVVFSLATGFLGAWGISRYACCFGLLDIPNDRSSHDMPTPRGGGIGIVIAYVFTSVAVSLPLFIWLPTASIAVVSLFDDKLGLTAQKRLWFQFTAAFVVVGFILFLGKGEMSITLQQPVASIPYLVSLALIFSVYITGTANFYNFMDGINGIAGITGIVGFALLGRFAQLYCDVPAVVLSAFCVSAACLGFLPLNFPKARVFMGDVGSILLGFVFASYVVLLARDLSDFLLLAGFLSTIYADALTTLVIRWRASEKLSKAHRRHLYQLFANQMHVTHWKVSSGYGLLQLAIGIVLLWLRPFGGLAVAAFELVMVVVWLLLMIRIRKAVEA